MWMNYLGQCPAENKPWRKGPGPAVPGSVGGSGGVGREGRQPCPGGRPRQAGHPCLLPSRR